MQAGASALVATCVPCGHQVLFTGASYKHTSPCYMARYHWYTLMVPYCPGNQCVLQPTTPTHVQPGTVVSAGQVLAASTASTLWQACSRSQGHRSQPASDCKSFSFCVALCDSVSVPTERPCYSQVPVATDVYPCLSQPAHIARMPIQHACACSHGAGCCQHGCRMMSKSSLCSWAANVLSTTDGMDAGCPDWQTQCWQISPV